MRIASLLALSIFVLAHGTTANAQDTASQTATIEDIKQSADLPSSAPLPPPVTLDLAKPLQAELKRVGCLQGPVDGVWGDISKAALADAARRGKLNVPTDAPTPIALDTLKGRNDRICPLACGAGQIEQNGTCVAKAVPAAKPAARPHAAAEARAVRARPERERPSGGMCLRNDGRGQSLVPCSEAPGAIRAY